MHPYAMNDSDPHELHVWSVLSCLGVSSRYRLVRALAAEDRCVGELAEMVGLSQSCTTRHLQALERAGLVKGQREGRRVRFKLRSEAPGLSEILGWALTGVGVPAADAEPARWQDPAPGGDVGPPAIAGTAPARRPADMEDYLL